MHQKWTRNAFAFILLKFLHTWSKHFTVDFIRGSAWQTALTSALKIVWSWSLGKCLFWTVSLSESESISWLLSVCLRIGCGAKHLSLSMLQKEMILLKYHESAILVVVHVSCDFKVCSLAFISWFVNLYVPVVNVDLTKPLAKYAGKIALFCCLSTLRCWLPGPSRRLAPVLKCRRFVFSTLHC